MWKVGDYAVIVKRGLIRCEHNVQFEGAENPKTEAPLRVVDVIPIVLSHGPRAGTPCGCLSLHFADGSHGHASRFRRIVPDNATSGLECKQLIQLIIEKEREDAPTH
jgi:hypothetical protein